MQWLISDKKIKSLTKDGKEIIKVERVKDGKILYEKKENDYCMATVTGDSVTLGADRVSWLSTVDDVIINWGDGTTTTVNNPSTPLTHSYTDGKQSHNIAFIGKVTSLGNSCFNNCTGLTSIVIPSSVTDLGIYCFRGCTSLTSITIPPNVTSLGSNCFNGCTNLTSITIPSSVTSLGVSCFNSCTNLTSVTISSSVTNFGPNCFSDCTSLASITIPSSVRNLGTQCFRNCTNLIEYQLYWENDKIVRYNSSTMPNNTNTKFYVPEGQKIYYINMGYPSDKVVERSS